MRGGRCLSYAAGARKEISVTNSVAFDGSLERLSDMLLADELVERLRSIPPGDNHILAGGGVVGGQERGAFVHDQDDAISPRSLTGG